MKILVTGANGFLGHYLVPLLLEKGYSVIATGKGPGRLPGTSHPRFTYASLDFTDPWRVHDAFESFQPDVVVHAGAMSRPDACEKNQAAAYAVNVEGTVHLLLNAGEQKSFFIFLSTDFIFDGEKGLYTEEDQPAPLNYYGRTKCEAEAAVREYPFDWAIVRTVLVYGAPLPGRPHILSVVRDKLEKGEAFSLVDDQWRTPTYAGDLAKGIAAIIQKKASGIFHLSGRDRLTPYRMALQEAEWLGLEASLISPVTAADFTEPAKRPLLTGFRIDKAEKFLGYDPVSFAEGLKLSIPVRNKN